MRQNGNGIGNGIRQSGKTDPAITKAYEICYALFRVGMNVQNKVFAGSLERKALRLLDKAISGNGAEMQDAATAVHYLVGFGEGIGFIHPTNAETIRNELAALAELTVLPDKTALPEEVPLGDIFSKRQEALFVGNPAKNNPANGKTKVQSGNQHPATDLPEFKSQGNESGNGSASGNDNPAIRQSAILDKIRQSGNCRMKDIMEVLPDASERTIRYDLQSLVEQNLVERVGAGGPMVFYRPR